MLQDPYMRQVRAQIEYHSAFNSDKWCRLIPKLQFDPDWEVQVIPPTVGAVVRFRVFKGSKEVSVYLDCYDCLGSVGEPYWEIYPAADRDTARFLMADTQGLLAGIDEALDA